MDAISQVQNHTDSDKHLEEIGKITIKARAALEIGDARKVGELMNQNQNILNELGLSTPKLTKLAESAVQAGALGAKLSGSGLGGVVIAICNKSEEAKIIKNWTDAGCTKVYAINL